MITRLRQWVLSGVLVLLMLSVAAAGGAWLYYRLQRSEYEGWLEKENARLQREKEALNEMVERLSRTHRVAQIVVTSQKLRPESTTTTGESGASAREATVDPTRRSWTDIFNTVLGPMSEDEHVIETTLLIAEIDDEGKTLNKQSVTIPGSIAFFDGLVVKFDKESVAKGHPLRGRSIALFRRVYSERLAPQNGRMIDQPDRIPPGYRIRSRESEVDSEVRDEFEKRIWSQFWTLANDPERAREAGIRVAQGEAVYKRVRPGVLYELSIDAAGGLNLETKPLPEAVSDVLAAVTGKSMPQGP